MNEKKFVFDVLRGRTNDVVCMTACKVCDVTIESKLMSYILI